MPIGAAIIEAEAVTADSWSDRCIVVWDAHNIPFINKVIGVAKADVSGLVAVLVDVADD